MNQITSMPDQLLNALRELIQQGRQRALRVVDMVQVQTCWEVGRHIVEFEQGGCPLPCAIVHPPLPE